VEMGDRKETFFEKMQAIGFNLYFLNNYAQPNSRIV
jgi:hypothetical protein